MCESDESRFLKGNAAQVAVSAPHRRYDFRMYVPTNLERTGP